MNDAMRAMRARALQDEAFREALLATQRASEPLSAFCALARENGFALTEADVLGEGDALACQQMKSTNGGNPLPYECFDDAYEMFLFSIRR